MSSPSTMTLTPRIRVARHAPSHYDRSSTSQIASSSKANFSKLPEFSQLMDVDMDMDVDMEGTDALTDNDTASEKSTATTTPQQQPNAAAKLRALMARFPTTSTTPTQISSQNPPEREPDYDLSIATRGAPSVQESVRSIFSKALGDSEETPTRPLKRRDSIEDGENEATPMPGRPRGMHRSFKGSDSGESAQSSRASRFQGSSQPLTQEFLRERFKETDMSDTEFIPSPMTSRDFSMKTSSIIEENLGASAAPSAASTPQQSLSLSVGSRFQSNLLENNTEMRYALDYSDSQEDLFSDAEIPDEKPDSGFAMDISNVSHNRFHRLEARGDSASSASTHKAHDTPSLHSTRNLSLTSEKSQSPSASHQNNFVSQQSWWQTNAERTTGRFSTTSHGSDIQRDREEDQEALNTSDTEEPMRRSTSFAREPVHRATRTPSPLPISPAQENVENTSRRSDLSYITRPAIQRSPSPFKPLPAEEQSTNSGRDSYLSTTPRASRATEYSRPDSSSTPVARDRRHNDSSAWTASMSIDTWQHSPYQQASPRFPEQILQEEDQHFATMEEVPDEEVPATPMKTPRMSPSGRPEFDISSPSPSKVPALPSPDSSPQSETKVPWAYNRARHPMTPAFATPKPPGGWLATPKQPVHAGEGKFQAQGDTVVHSEQPTFTKTPRPPGGWMATPVPNPVPFTRNSEVTADNSDVLPRDGGLLTPIPSLSKMPALNLKTPAPPGAWAQTPAARKSILKVRFDADSPNNPLSNGPSRRQPLLPDDDDSNIDSSPSRIKPRSPKIRVLDAFGREADDDDDEKTEVPNANKSKIRVVDDMGEEVKSEPDDGPSVPRAMTLTQLRQGLNELMEEIDDFDDISKASEEQSRVQDLIKTSALARQNAAQIRSNMKHGLKSQHLSNKNVYAWWYWPLVCVGQILFGALIFFFCLRLTKTMFLENYWEPFNPELNLQAFDTHDFLQANRTIWFSSRTLEWLYWYNYLPKPTLYLWHLWEFVGGMQAGELWPLT